VLRANTSSELIINVFRVNMLGFKTPFSKVYVRFEIEEGANLIEVTSYTGESAKIRSKGIEGEAVVGVYSLKSGALVSKVVIKILPRDYAQLAFLFLELSVHNKTCRTLSPAKLKASMKTPHAGTLSLDPFQEEKMTL